MITQFYYLLTDKKNAMFATQFVRYRYRNPLRVSVALATAHWRWHMSPGNPSEQLWQYSTTYGEEISG